MKRVLLIIVFFIGLHSPITYGVALAQPNGDDLGLDDNFDSDQSEHNQPPPPPHSEGRPQHDRMGERGQGMRKMREQFAQKLGITDDQKKKIHEIRGDHSSREKSQLQERLARIELRELIQKGTASDEEVMSKVHELNKMLAKQNEERVGRLLAIRKILTPEQREKLKSMRDEHGGEMRERLGERMRSRIGEGMKPRDGEIGRPRRFGGDSAHGER